MTDRLRNGNVRNPKERSLTTRRHKKLHFCFSKEKRFSSGLFGTNSLVEH